MGKSNIRTTVTSKIMSDLRDTAVAKVNKRVPLGPTSEVAVSRMRRIEVLDLKDDADVERWQVLHNDVDRYEVISEKFTQLKGNYEGEHSCTVIYDEMGEDLPLTKTQSELRTQDAKAKRNALKNVQADFGAFDAES